MFDLNALVILTVLNLIALVQIAANILAPAKLQRGPIVGAAAVCLATSLTGLAMALLVPSPIVGIASITIAALVNLMAVLGTGLDHLSDPRSAQAMQVLRGLARLAIVGAPHETALAGIPARAHSSVRPRTPARHSSVPTSSAPRTVPASGQATVTHVTPDPLPKLLAAASRLAQNTSKASRPVKSAPRASISAPTLTPRQNFIVPHRPNRLPTSSLAFLLSVNPEQEPDIFADSRARLSQLPALARRVSLVSYDPRRPTLHPQSSSVWPTHFSEPDPAWKTSYGRLPAIAMSI